MRGVRVVLVVALASAAAGCAAGERTAAEPLPPTPARVQITMHDYRFEMAGEIPRGRVVVEVTNQGTVNHALTLISLPDGFPPLDEQLRGDERRGAASVARVPARPPGEGSKFALDAQPGRYGLVCFVADADGLTHGQKGMNFEFRVL
ncbi:MAG TPA: hypothetical protein VF045_02935 [Acidimicrobiales bacterium]